MVIFLFGNNCQLRGLHSESMPAERGKRGPNATRHATQSETETANWSMCRVRANGFKLRALLDVWRGHRILAKRVSHILPVSGLNGMVIMMVAGAVSALAGKVFGDFFWRRVPAVPSPKER